MAGVGWSPSIWCLLDLALTGVQLTFQTCSRPLQNSSHSILIIIKTPTRRAVSLHLMTRTPRIMDSSAAAPSRASSQATLSEFHPSQMLSSL
ncbi:hypothetical protein BKA82DRAFT_4148784 [Pisolithus tinctorius]|nr:hypothetical protein BKA82DRAFT_4148784 [Pisolithus tinctorius]